VVIRLLASGAAILVVVAIATTAAVGSTTTERFAVTLTAELDTRLEYFLPGAREDGCSYLQLGRTYRLSEIRSASPTIVRVRRGRPTRYAPSALRSLRVTRRDYGGDVRTTTRCPDGTTFSESRECEPAAGVTSEALASLAFRATRGRRVSWSALTQPPMTPCGLEQEAVEAGWLDLATARVNERALLESRRRTVRVSAERLLADVVIPRPGATPIRRSLAVRWTLTFRRLR
jgi:hypothetical protein